MNKKVGIWQTAIERGNVIERFDFDNKKKLLPIITIYPHYPKSAVDTKLQGTVIVSFQTHEDCSISNISITKSLSTDCDSAAIEAMNIFSGLFKKYGVECQEKTLTHEYNFTFN